MACLSGDDSVISQLHPPLPQIFASFLSDCTKISDLILSEPPRYNVSAADSLEISLRRQCLELIHANVSSTSEVGKIALKELEMFWTGTLSAVYHVIQSVEQTTSSVVEVGAQSVEESSEIPMEGARVSAFSTTADGSTGLLKSVLPHATFLRKLPIVLLDDLLETLSLPMAFSLWKACVPGSLLFSETLWNKPIQHPCWLPFLKTSNKFMRRLQSESSNSLGMENGPVRIQQSFACAAAEILLLLSTVYPLSEKSSTRTWGSQNADHWAIVESELEFGSETIESIVPTSDAFVGVQGSTNSNFAVPCFSFYETFWNLQHDFRNLSGIVVAEFLQRLKTVLNCLKSQPVLLKTMSNGSSKEGAFPPSGSNENELLLVPYLTHGRLLAIQLSEPTMRTMFLTQLYIVARHLMSQVPTLRTQLQAHLSTAEALFPDDLDRLRIERVLETSEEQWRAWKQNKFVPDLDQQRQRQLSLASATLRKRKRGNEMHESPDNVSFNWVGSDLASVAQKLKSAVPSERDHLEEYVEALDPESGIEDEYHPKFVPAFCWRALRLMATADYLADFELIHPNGDFEGMVRHVYSTAYGISIPGRGIDPFEDVDEDATDEIDETVQNGLTQDATQSEESKMGCAKENDAGSAMDCLAEGESIERDEVVDQDDRMEVTDASDGATKVNGEAVSSPPDKLNGADDASFLKRSSSVVVSTAASAPTATRTLITTGDTRERDTTDRSRSDNGHHREPSARDPGRREPRDLGHFGGGGRRADPPRDGHGRGDDRGRGNGENLRRGDRRVGGGTSTDGDARRNDRREGEPRRDEWRGDRVERYDRGRTEHDDRRGGRPNAGRRDR
jgi:THO complex subunit 1